jgi:hypothetical protein
MLNEVSAAEMVFSFKFCTFFKEETKENIEEYVYMYIFTRAYIWILLSQFRPMHTSTTIHNMNTVLTADFCVGSYINTTYCWVLSFVVETCFEK